MSGPFPPTALRRRHAQTVRDCSFSYHLAYVTMIKNGAGLFWIVQSFHILPLWSPISLQTQWHFKRCGQAPCVDSSHPDNSSSFIMLSSPDCFFIRSWENSCLGLVVKLGVVTAEAGVELGVRVTGRAERAEVEASMFLPRSGTHYHIFYTTQSNPS